MRLLAAEAGVHLARCRGDMDERDWQRLSKTISDISDAPFYIDDSPNMAMNDSVKVSPFETAAQPGSGGCGLPAAHVFR